MLPGSIRRLAVRLGRAVDRFDVAVARHARQKSCRMGSDADHADFVTKACQGVPHQSAHGLPRVHEVHLHTA